MSGRLAGLKDALSRSKSSDLNLRGENLGFIVVQKLE
jgi:hypothetical protein